MLVYLLDTNICIYFCCAGAIILIVSLFRSVNQIAVFRRLRSRNYYLGLRIVRIFRKRKIVESLAARLEVIPIASSLDVFAREKARLSKSGKIIDDFDLLIGATAIANDLILVTNNEKHFSRLEGIEIENWISKG